MIRAEDGGQVNLALRRWVNINSSGYNSGIFNNRSLYEIAKLRNASIAHLLSHKMCFSFLFFFESRKKKDKKLC